MYYPVGWHKVLKVDFDSNSETSVISIQANHERELFFILTTTSLHIWYSKPAVEIVSHRRSKESIEKIGLNTTAVWKTDSNVIVVATSRDQLLFYQVRRRILSTGSSLLLQNAPEGDGIYRLRQDTKNLKNILVKESRQKSLLLASSSESIPPLTIFSFGKLDLSAIGVSCLLSAEEELIVGARNGDIYGIHWDGNVDEKFPWSLSKQVKSQDYVVDLKFSSVLSGFALVFFSGKIGFMPLKSSEKEKENLNLANGVDKSKEETRFSYLEDVNNAICVEMNHKYRLAAFGLKDSKILVCNINDLNSSLVINHKLELHQSNSAKTMELGSVGCMQYSPDNFALVTCWETGVIAIWSVFGSLLFCSNQWQPESLGPASSATRFTSIAWGQEGYNLWISTTYNNIENGSTDQSLTNHIDSQSQQDSESINSKTENTSTFYKDDIIILPLAHSSLTSSPHLTCSSDSVILISEERIYIGPSVPQKAEFDHWLQVDIPLPYLNENYPIRYAAVDRECKMVAIAGNKGFALYSIDTNEWKFFGKKSHEESFSVCGDLIFWRDYLVTSCINLETDNFELRAYLTSETLSSNHSNTLPTKLEIIRMSIFENRLLVLYSDGTLSMFMLSLRKRPLVKKSKVSFTRSNSIGGSNDNNNNETAQKSDRADSIMSLNYPLRKNPLFGEVTLQISPIENLVISNLQANAYCISAIALTRLHFKNNRSDDSILLNACGKLFLLEREAPHNRSTPSPDSDFVSEMNGLSIGDRNSRDLDVKVNSVKRLNNSSYLASASLRSTTESSALSNVTFRAVSVIATNVEQFWISPEISSASEMSYFKKSLWLSRGGMKNFLQVWLPLLNDKNDPPTDLYVPERIMLPIRCDIYPLSIRSSTPDVIEPDDAIVLGAESDILYKDSEVFTNFPYCTVKRQCRVYLHRVLRELLLNQHLGYYAKKIAESCQSLPYFAHCFELLLHEVLEEEATSPVPLPDPMLPQIVKFIKEFPVYLETVVHCARKSELSMWSHLFDEKAVGNPRRLFQECLEKHKLDTAASCLIILQGLDRNIVSQNMVRELIKEAKDDEKYSYLIDELENFLNRAELDYSTSNSNSVSPTT